MRPERAPLAHLPIRAASLALALALVGGCAALRPAVEASRPGPAQAAPDPAAIRAAELAEATLALHRFVGAPPDQQTALMAAARQAAEQAPTPASQLRYALLLAQPGHAGTDLNLARQLLQSLLAEPARLAPMEHASAFLELRRIDRELALAAEVDELRAKADLIDSEALSALNRRLLAETDENQRLRRALEEAQAKLAAIALIERQTRDREPDDPVPQEAP
jgi:hypothetical protein